MQSVRISGCIKSYAWGSRDILPALFHYTSDGSPQAEAWFGVHPDGPSRLEDGRTLSQYITDSGDGKADAFPLMMKVLAINSPLSLHVHPDSIQAGIGWQNDELMRRSGADPDMLDFKDANGKNELFLAMTPTTLMAGFRPFEDAVFHLRRLMPSSFEAHFSRSRTVRGLVKTLFTLEDGELRKVTDEFLAGLESAGEELSRGSVYLTERGIAQKIFSLFGYDPGVAAVYLMNVIHLRIGEAAYIRSGLVHSYVHGSGIELEDSSDNEKRLGMSRKHIDVAGALNLIDFEAGFSGKAELAADSFLRQRAYGNGWSLGVLRSGSYDIRDRVPSLVLCTEGKVRVGTADGHLDLCEGECAFISGHDCEYHIRVGGRAYQAVFPEDNEL